MHAFFATGGKQYRAEKGAVIHIERIEGDEGAEIRFDQVFAVQDGDDVRIGTPTVENAVVIGEIKAQDRHKKIIVFKKRRRQNSRRKNGHRQHRTVIEITDIVFA
ncbi:MAG: 50S ribosomal protein L21 [Alphaproteobacteria bacterium]|nr:50S ribosomal protein L21 [Alphaproteobacteria bacterium]